MSAHHPLCWYVACSSENILFVDLVLKITFHYINFHFIVLQHNGNTSHYEICVHIPYFTQSMWRNLESDNDFDQFYSYFEITKFLWYQETKQSSWMLVLHNHYNLSLTLIKGSLSNSIFISWHTNNYFLLHSKVGIAPCSIRIVKEHSCMHIQITWFWSQL